jgi:hypothetical protein
VTESQAPSPPTREHRSLTAAAEKRLLVWMGNRMPAAVNSDHLTALGLAGGAMAGVGYALAGRNPVWLHFVNLGRSWLLFDLLAAFGTAGLAFVALRSAAQVTKRLYDEERLKQPRTPGRVERPTGSTGRQ